MNKVRYSKNSDINSLESLIQASFVLIVSYLNLLSNNKLSEKEIKKTIPFTIASKKIRINLTTDVEHLYTKNYKTLIN